MENFFLISIVLLFVLAIIDLVVGVSNDAVNFLNSAIGSMVSNRRNIMILASLGILFGAASSAGLMEVARKGIYNPEYFHFDEIIFICLAVMLTDVFLLNLFNSLALPTSTTVSVVFELLGAAFVMSIIKILSHENPMNYLFDSENKDLGIIGYMNWESAGQIILGIFLSVLIAFLIGAMTQYISRLIFTHHFENKMKYFGGLYGGIAVTILFHFLFFKGLKGADQSVQDFFRYDYLKEHTIIFLIVLFLFSVLLMQILVFLKINIFKIIVLIGTFALAMAFAGNDLVNFIGVPIAGFESYKIWKISGSDPSELLMSQMQDDVATPYVIIIAAGIIMVITLWFSKKARNVTETEVNLSRQMEGEERFKPNTISRGIVRLATKFTYYVELVLPESIKNKLSKRLAIHENTLAEGQAFDLVRASVNLVVASALIAGATQMKLPLSTTYVSFMVAMGTSLADQAWGRESAVYRVAGVLNIIAGWFLTAAIAFGVAGLFLFIIYTFHWVGMIGILLFVIISALYFSNFYLDFIKPKKVNDFNMFMPSALEQVREHNIAFLSKIKEVYELSLEGLAKENVKKMKTALKLIKEQQNFVLTEKEKVLYLQKDKENIDDEALYLHIKNTDLKADLVASLNNMVDTLTKHIFNSHLPLKKEQKKTLDELTKIVVLYLDNSIAFFQSKDISKLDDLISLKKEVYETSYKVMYSQTKLMKSGEVGFKNNKTMLSICLESRDMIAVTARLMKLLKKVV